MSSIPHIITGSSITAVCNGRSYIVERSNPHAQQIIKALADPNSTPENIQGLFDLATAINTFMSGVVEVRDGVVLYAGNVVHNVVTDRILEFMQSGLDHAPLARFLEKLMKNPSRHSVTQLYSFLEKEGLPLTETGNFIAYKGVDESGYSRTSGPREVVLKGVVDSGGHIRNHVGDEIEMQRNYVCDNPQIHCSHGLHAGSYEYASSFGPRVVLVEIDPSDCVSVPNDCDCQKLRVCRYKVVADCAGLIRSPLVKDPAAPYQTPVEPEDTWDDVNMPVQVRKYDSEMDQYLLVCNTDDVNTIEDAVTRLRELGATYTVTADDGEDVTEEVSKLVMG